MKIVPLRGNVTRRAAWWLGYGWFAKRRAIAQNIALGMFIKMLKWIDVSFIKVFENSSDTFIKV